MTQFVMSTEPVQDWSHDIEYIQSLRDRAIGFEMEAFYDARLKEMTDARFRSLMMSMSMERT